MIPPDDSDLHVEYFEDIELGDMPAEGSQTTPTSEASTRSRFGSFLRAHPVWVGGATLIVTAATSAAITDAVMRLLDASKGMPATGTADTALVLHKVPAGTSGHTHAAINTATSAGPSYDFNADRIAAAAKKTADSSLTVSQSVASYGSQQDKSTNAHRIPVRVRANSIEFSGMTVDLDPAKGMLKAELTDGTATENFKYDDIRAFHKAYTAVVGAQPSTHKNLSAFVRAWMKGEVPESQ